MSEMLIDDPAGTSTSFDKLPSGSQVRQKTREKIFDRPIERFSFRLPF